MIHEVDSALRALIEREASGTRDVEILFDAPTRDWAGRRNSPTIDIYLYDIREDLRRRERGVHNVYDDSNIIVARHMPPRHFKLSYLVTAWTQRPEDEHRLLSSLLTCFLKYDALPRDVLSEPLTDLGLPIPLTIALPPPEDRAFADVWSALGGELKPSIDLVVTTPLNTGQEFHTGPPVQRPPQVSLGGSSGWPNRETKSRNGVVVWPDGTRQSGPALARDDESRPSPDGDEPATRTRRGSRRTSGSADQPVRTRQGDRSDDEPGAESDGWELATGWAAALPPLGSAESAEPIPERAAGRHHPGTRATGGPPVDSRETGSPDRSDAGDGAEPASDAPAARRRSAGTAKKAAAGSGKTGGRPGPRVAITRTRQPKKSS